MPAGRHGSPKPRAASLTDPRLPIVAGGDLIARPETMVVENDMAVVATIGSIAQMTSCRWTISAAAKR